MKTIDRGTIFPSMPATDRQSCAFPQVPADAPFHRIALLPVDGYAILFLLALICLAFGWWCYGRVKPDDVHTTRTVLARMVNGMWGWRPW